MDDHAYHQDQNQEPLTRLQIFDHLRERRLFPTDDSWIQEAINYVLEQEGLIMDQLTEKSMKSLYAKIEIFRKDLRQRIKSGKYAEFRKKYKTSYLDKPFEWDRETTNEWGQANFGAGEAGDTVEVDKMKKTTDKSPIPLLLYTTSDFEDMDSDSGLPGSYVPKKTKRKHVRKKVKGGKKLADGKKRKKKEFSRMSKSGQNKRIRKLRNVFEDEEILRGSKQIIGVDRKGGKFARNILTGLCEDKNFGRYLTKKMAEKTVVKMKDAEALAFYVKNQQSRTKYNSMRFKCKEMNADCWPSYYKLTKEKVKTYPTGMIVSDYNAQNSLQSMLERTVERLLLVPGVQERIAEIKRNANGKKVTLTFRYKWGFDGTLGGPVYREGAGSAEVNMVENVLLSQMAFLELRCLETGELVTRNQFANSSSGMRPLRISFEPESVANVRQEHERITLEAAAVTPVDIEEGVSVEFEDFPTLFDGKALAYIHGEASQVCHLCGHGPIDMSIPGKKHPITNPEGIRNGLTNLHAGPRFMEFGLHISYYLWWLHWSIRYADDEQRQDIEDRKCSAHWVLYFFLGILVDKVKKTGGTSNDGNTARVFFQNPELTAELLELPKDFLCSLALLWKIIRCSHEVDLEKVKLAVERFKASFWGHFRDTSNTNRARDGITWFYIASSVHRLSEHLVELLEACPMPPGMLSEEGSESNNKILRFIREHLTRKMSRQQTMEDLFHRLIAVSDPLVLHYNREEVLKHRAKRPVDPELAEFLKNPEDAGEWDDAADDNYEDILRGFDGLAEAPGPEDIDEGDLIHEEDVEGGVPTNGRQGDFAERDFSGNDRQEGLVDEAGDTFLAASKGKGKKDGKGGKSQGKKRKEYIKKGQGRAQPRGQEVNGETETEKDKPDEGVEEPPEKRRRKGDEGALRLSDYLKNRNKKDMEDWEEDPEYVRATTNPRPNLQETPGAEDTVNITDFENMPELVPHNHEELLETVNFVQRREIIEEHGYRPFVQWFEERHFFNYWQLNGVGNVPLHLLTSRPDFHALGYEPANDEQP